MKNISKIISTFFLIFSILLLCYVFYRSEIYSSGTKHDEYLRYYIISFILFFLSIVSFFIKKDIKIKVLAVLLSTFFGLYLVEGYFLFETIKSKKNARLQTKSKLQIYQDLKKNDTNSVVSILPGLLKIDNKTIFTLSGISNRKTLFCNENEYYSIYQSDRYGFNNPDSEWDKEQITLLLIGDSFTHGACVNEPDTIGGNLRKNIKSGGVLNLGQRGNGPLIEYATLREYLPLTKTERVLWIYYEGNDLLELSRELNNKILLKYLNNQNFTQNLYLKQGKIDTKRINDLKKSTKLLKKENLNFSKNENLNHLKFEFINFLKLFNTRKLTIEKMFYGASPKDLKKILELSKKFAEINGAKFYFIYLPEYHRYIINLNINNNYKNYKKIIGIVESLNIPLIDIHKELFQSHNDPKSFFPFRSYGHYNKLGYKMVAEIISNKIKGFEHIK
jgi:lysophospholipase L1-like esterase